MYHVQKRLMEVETLKTMFYMDSVISSKLIFRWYGRSLWHTSLWKRLWSHGCRAFSSPASDISPRVAPSLPLIRQCCFFSKPHPPHVGRNAKADENLQIMYQLGSNMASCVGILLVCLCRDSQEKWPGINEKTITSSYVFAGININQQVHRILGTPLLFRRESDFNYSHQGTLSNLEIHVCGPYSQQ